MYIYYSYVIIPSPLVLFFLFCLVDVTPKGVGNYKARRHFATSVFGLSSLHTRSWRQLAYFARWPYGDTLTPNLCSSATIYRHGDEYSSKGTSVSDCECEWPGHSDSSAAVSRQVHGACSCWPHDGRLATARLSGRSLLFLVKKKYNC